MPPSAFGLREVCCEVLYFFNAMASCMSNARDSPFDKAPMNALPHLIPAVFSLQLFFLLVGHALADYPWQGPYLSEAKNPDSTLGQNGVWPWAMASHGLIHGGLVAAITGYLWLGVAEFLIHCAIDLMKCKKIITFTQDQLLHVGYKVVWACIVCFPHASPLRSWLS